jgi:hypothetical protein
MGFRRKLGTPLGRHTHPNHLFCDLMEALRLVVDRILESALARTFTPVDFTISNKGERRLNLQMVKVIADLMATNPNNRMASNFLGQFSSWPA